MHAIILRRVDGLWHAYHTDPRVIELFGTDTLPTPFSAEVPADTVVVRIRMLNPDCHVWARASERGTPDGWRVVGEF